MKIILFLSFLTFTTAQAQILDEVAISSFDKRLSLEFIGNQSRFTNTGMVTSTSFGNIIASASTPTSCIGHIIAKVVYDLGTGRSPLRFGELTGTNVSYIDSSLRDHSENVSYEDIAAGFSINYQMQDEQRIADVWVKMTSHMFHSRLIHPMDNSDLGDYYSCTLYPSLAFYESFMGSRIVVRDRASRHILFKY